MPTFKQLIGPDREIPDESCPEWIRQEVAIYILSEAHEYLSACRDVHDRVVDDELLLLHGTILEIRQKLEVRHRMSGLKREADKQMPRECDGA